MKKPSTLAQGTTEYALILALVALVVLVVLALFGKQIAAAYQSAVDGFSNTPAAAGVPSTPGAPVATSEVTSEVTSVVTSTPIALSIQSIAQDFMDRTLAYRKATGKWPPTEGDAYFKALGLDPSDYKGPVSGIVWEPNGQYIGLTPAAGTQVYVTTAKGKQVQLYDGWDIWCHADNGGCYFHDKGLGQEVDLNTVVVKSK